jgi:thiamine-monophosphate kinase
VARRSTSAGSERERIALIARLLAPKTKSRDVVLGIGDDAAIVRARGLLVWTVDSAVEGVHFDLDWLDPKDIGYRATQAAVSDLAAMGARPLGAVSNLGLPKHFTKRDLERLLRGQAEAARELGCPIIGGNLARARELSITTSALGSARTPLLRSGARAGDELWLLGDVGLARAGLLAFQAGRASNRKLAPAVRAFARPRARLREGLSLIGRAHAALDVSDGLAGDAGHLAEASGVGLVISEARLREALPRALAGVAAELSRDPLELALFGGEDYALLATGPSRRRPRTAKVIGRVEAGRGISLETRGGRRRSLSGGFDHFAG